MVAELTGIFSKIYSKKRWGSGTAVNPLSGVGSNPDNARAYVYLVSQIIKAHVVSSVVDLGHGDWSMWRDYKFEDTNYLGLEVVPVLIENCTRTHGTLNRKFQLYMGAEFLQSADLFLCKDVFQHLSMEQIKLILRELDRFRYLVICNDIFLPMGILSKLRFNLKFRFRIRKLLAGDLKAFLAVYSVNNCEIDSGEWRGVDIEREIFSSYLSNFKVIERIDYGTSSRGVVCKRILFMENLHLERL